MTRALVVVVALAALAGCHPSSQSRRSRERRVDQAEYEILDRIEHLSRAVTEAGADCGRLAAGLDAWHDGNEVELPGLMAEARAGSNLSGDELAKIEERVEEVLTSLAAAAGRCGATAEAKAAAARVDHLLES